MNATDSAEIWTRLVIFILRPNIRYATHTSLVWKMYKEIQMIKNKTIKVFSVLVAYHSCSVIEEVTWQAQFLLSQNSESHRSFKNVFKNEWWSDDVKSQIIF